ncbi:hypothetical protein JCM6882_001436 [Rhodosporidiobolus microsporus]
MTSPLPPLAQATSGSLGAVLSNALVFPLDTLTSRLQTSSRSARRRSAPHPKKREGGYSSLLAAVRTVWTQEGWRAFYAGLGPDSLSTLISQFLYFFLYSALRNGLMERRLRKGVGVQVASSPSSSGSGAAKGEAKRPAPPLLSAVEELAVGCLAGVVAKGIVSPLSMITVRAQTSKEAKQDVEGGKAGDKTPVDEGALPRKSGAGGDGKKNGDDSDDESEDGDYGQAPSAVKIAREIYDEQGVAGFWSGFGSTVFLTINPAITYYSFAALQRALIPAKHRTHPTPGQTFICGALASAIASAITYPLILAKTRLQFRSPTGRRLYRSQLDVFRKTLKQGGIAGLYSGLESQLIKGFLSEGIKLLIKDRVELLIIVAHRIASRNRSRTVA